MRALTPVRPKPSDGESEPSTDAETLVNRGDAHLTLRRWREALENYDRAIEISPADVRAHNNRGTALKELGQFEEALDGYDRAIGLLPDRAELYNNRGNVLQGLDRLEEAIESYDTAIRLSPNYAEAYSNRGVALRQMKRLEEAVVSFERATQLRPDFPEALMNRGLLELVKGNFAEGWRLCEARHRTRSPLGHRGFDKPMWSGDADPSGKTILIHAEGGYGDVILLSRYASMLRDVGARVLFAPQRPLRTLLAGLTASVRIVDLKTSPILFDYHCSTMSLPFAFRTELATIPRGTYLVADESKVAAWGRWLGTKTKPRVGIVWSRAGKPDGGRTVPLGDYRQLLEMDFEFVSLQRDATEEERAYLEHLGIRHPGEALFDFSDTAALCRSMDVVLSIDTSVVHVAAAQGIRTWVLVPWYPGWIWMLDRENSPWYPSVRLFRQQARGDWTSVLSRVRRELQAELGASSA